MSAAATRYLTLHVRGITTSQRAALSVWADMSDDQGRSRWTQAMVAYRLELSRRQVERHARALQAAGCLERDGRVWKIVGVDEHDLSTCDDPVCIKEYRRTCRPRPTSRPPDRADERGAAGRVPTAAPPLATAMVDAAQADPAMVHSPVGRYVRSGNRKYKRRARPP